MKNAILFGFGNIGKVLAEQIPKEKIDLKYIVNSKGVFDSSLSKQGDLSDWKIFANDIGIVFITIPTVSDGAKALEYASFFLEKDIPVVTCEKASIANHFEYFKKHENIFKFTASVGGGTKMLERLSKFDGEVFEIKGIVNGTLNFIGDSLKKGINKNEIVKEILEKGFAEPGANTFEEIIEGELNDIRLKTVILANSSGMFEKIIGPQDIKIARKDLAKRCIVKISKEKIEAGFLEDNDAEWLPDGVNNVLYINTKKVCFGPGAGAVATVESMLGDLKSLI
ncbi:MAG: homoserine dehydrogenase [Candidatus Taylorbacteria bacterium]|nr:homoserine dehydrogenase [Candidatus Taylorbacteria bacterium]